MGGRVRRLSRTFPFFNEDGFIDGLEFVADIEREMRAGSMVDVRLNTSVRSLEGQSPEFRVGLTDGSEEPVSAIALTTGFEPFDPTSLEEYGYGRYPNVVTATELEWMLNPRGPTGGRASAAQRPEAGGPAGDRVLRRFPQSPHRGAVLLADLLFLQHETGDHGPRAKPEELRGLFFHRCPHV